MSLPALWSYLAMGTAGRRGGNARASLARLGGRVRDGGVITINARGSLLALIPLPPRTPGLAHR